MSAATTEQQNNGDLAVAAAPAVEKSVTASAEVDAVKEDLKAKPAVDDTNSTPLVTADNGTVSKDNDDNETVAADAADAAADDDEDATGAVPAKEQTVNKATKRPAETKTPDSKKLKKDKVFYSESDEDEDILYQVEETDSDEYECNIPDYAEDDIDCEDDDESSTSDDDLIP